MESTRDRLVRVGVELMEESGSVDIGLREIARRAGVSHGAPRRWFPTHRALLSAIAAAGLADLTSAVEVSGRDLEGRASVAAAAESYVDFAVRRPAMFALMFRHDLLVGGGENLRATSRPLFGWLRRQLDELGLDETERRAAVLWSGVHGVAMVNATGAMGLVAPGVDHRIVVRDIIDSACQAGPLRT
ncbi:TetR/AcrR family transcriptional regulator [Williamsia sp. MIQD14]|uniref:TetR/AcrR family transcriptional regulator n=1 Tax=Williamsia sp. MIQD14 TaxID=3425703 RepID=UPI003DA11DD1